MLIMFLISLLPWLTPSTCVSSVVGVGVSDERRGCSFDVLGIRIVLLSSESVFDGYGDDDADDDCGE